MENYLDIVNKIDQFYNSAWDKLIIAGSLILLVVGFVIPIVTQLYIRQKQRYTLREMEKRFREQMLEYITLKEKEATERINEKMDEKITEIKEYMSQIKESSSGAIFHVQGTMFCDMGKYRDSLTSYLFACESLIKCKDWVNINRIFTTIKDRCLPNITKEDLNHIEVAYKMKLDDLLNNLEKTEHGGFFELTIASIRILLDHIKKTNT